MAPADRRHGFRRDDDRELDYILDRLRTLEQNFREDLGRLSDEVDDLRDSASEAGEVWRRALDDLRDAIDKRVRDLEQFHIEDRTRAREQIAERLRESERSEKRFQRIAAAGALAGVFGVAFGIAEHFAHF